MSKTEKSDHDRSTSRASTLQLENTETSEERPTFKSLPLLGKLKFIITFFTVEPFLLCYILPSVISAVAVQKLNLEKACRVNLNYSEEICSKLLAGEVDGIGEASAGSQVLVADMTAWRQPLQSGLPCLVILFVGAWSDRTGNRKALMMITLIGEFISSVGLMLTTYYFNEWPLFVTALIEALPPALTGGFSICLMAVYSYMADITSVEDRTFRIGLVAVIVTLGIPLGTSISGVLTNAVGYYGIFGINLVFYVIGFVYAYFRIHNVKKETSVLTRHPLLEFFHPKHVLHTVMVLFKKREGSLTLRVWLIILVHIVIVGPVYGEGGVIYLYTLQKYHFDIVDFSLFSTYSVLLGLCGTAIAITAFSKFLKMDDTLIGFIATACKVASSFVYAFAPTKGWFFAGPVVDLFGNSGVTAIRSLGTKVVQPDEVGRMASIIGLAEAFAPVVYTPLYSKVYSKTVSTLPGTFYLLGGIMTIPAFAIFLVMYWLQRKANRDIVKDPATKEQHVYDNEITKL